MMERKSSEVGQCPQDLKDMGVYGGSAAAVVIVEQSIDIHLPNNPRLN